MVNRSKKILIIEDESLDLKMLVDVFTREGFHVFEARDGEEGLKLALKEHPDLILLDMIMPIMDGITMLQKLREDKKGRDIPVIILSNLSDDRKVAETLEKGTYDYLIKADYDIKEVVEKVKKKLGIE